MTSINYTLYTAPTVRTTYSTIPTSTITAQAVVADGFTLSQTDYAGITSTAARSYTASGMVLVNTDGRNNATTSITDLAGRTVSVTDAANNTTTTVYDSVHDLAAVVTDAQGNTACYKYDHRGRKIAEWGTALQPACFGYDELNNMTMLMTFRGTPETNEDGSPSPSGVGITAGDPTTWMFDAATGLELSKTYADNTSVVKTYDAYNRLATETNARGYMKVHTYEHARGLLLDTTYYYSLQEGETEPVVNNFTTPHSFAYNHLGQLVQVIDAAGTRTLGYNNFGEQETDSLLADGVTHLITELRDEFGRSVGYTYAKNGAVQQTVSTGYGTDGRISTAGFMHGGEMKQFSYTYLAGSNLLQVLTKPSGMTLTQSYETTRDLLTGIAYYRGSTLVAQRTYSYDTLGRPTARHTSRQGSVVNDTFTHNTRSELSAATVNGTNYEYVYDNIGNRTSATEGEEVTSYVSNGLNQYTMIRRSVEDSFLPEFDEDGNQLYIQTETGNWALNYNAANRPTDFSSMDEEGNFHTVKCDYDSMGRRVFKKVISGNGTVTSHQRFIYRGYLQIACVDLTRTNHPCLWLITWDPTQPVATRPLAIQKDGTWYTYGLDLTKNVCEVFGATGYIRTAYTYSPFGQVTAAGNVTQPIQWSSEYHDSELGLVYYNYRHYNQVDGRWQGRDKYLILNIYNFCINSPFLYIDIKGNSSLIASFQLSPIYNKNPQYAFFNYVTISALHNSNGAFSWNIKWIVSESGDKGGYVWQHVLFSSTETPCQHNKQTYKINKNYTELWRVKPNSTEIHEEEGRHDQLAYISNAVYKSNGGKLICSKGSAIFKTRAKYYPDLSEEFVKEFKIESNSAAGTLLMKDGFNPLKGDSIGEIVRKVEMRWDNCSTVPTYNITPASIFNNTNLFN